MANLEQESVPPLDHKRLHTIVLTLSALLVAMAEPKPPAAAPLPPNDAQRAHAASLGINLDDFAVVTEGKASILYPNENQVFYNPVQEYNRDVSILMLKLFIEDLRKTSSSLFGS